MIFIDSQNTMGSKSFTMALADELRPALANLLTVDEFDDFELNLTQNMIYLADLADEKFNKVILLAEKSKPSDEKQALLAMMKADPRFNHRP